METPNTIIRLVGIFHLIPSLLEKILMQCSISAVKVNICAPECLDANDAVFSTTMSIRGRRSQQISSHYDLSLHSIQFSTNFLNIFQEKTFLKGILLTQYIINKKFSTYWLCLWFRLWELQLLFLFVILSIAANISEIRIQWV